MVPVLRDGDFVLIRRVFGMPKVGRLVVVDHPELGTVVKRVLRVIESKGGDAQLELVGENNASSSTEKLGRVRKSEVRGVVWWKVRRR